jgi:hypothetical protein
MNRSKKPTISPTPWNYEENLDDDFDIIDLDDEPVAIVYKEHDAKVIALAPQLLVMCEKLLHARTGDGLLDESSPLFAEASELIKAVKGDA